MIDTSLDNTRSGSDVSKDDDHVVISVVGGGCHPLGGASSACMSSTIFQTVANLGFDMLGHKREDEVALLL